jgi:serine/threonine-protein kinase
MVPEPGLRASLKEAFGQAIELPASERAAFLEALSREQPQLAAEVRSLIASHEEAGEFLDAAVAAERDAILEEADEERWIGRRIGAYRVLRLLGAGGMGAVYLAERVGADPVQQVAIKLVRAGSNARSLLRRFRSERQALASLVHPNIARFLDAGTAEDGSPYLVMEYVDGESIESYCEERGLGLSERLRLFRTVCAAVEHAHRHLVVHRDLKPGNILVTADGDVKLLDFGIAKLLSREETGAQALTQTSERFRTTDFASPEQVAGGPITTATDVYSLGVLLYRLIAGVHPYRLALESYSEADRIIREEVPARPSAAARTPWRRTLKGDLDTIAGVALRKEPERRYASVEQLSGDVRRYLEGLPLSARKDELSYRAGKFLRRHRLAVVAAALLFVSLAGGMAATFLEARVARAERDRARLEAAKAERINQFLQGLFASADPNWYSAGRGRGGEIKVVEVLADAERRVEKELSAEPEIAAELHQTIGGTYLGLGMAEKAEPHFRRAFQLDWSLGRKGRAADHLYYLGAARSNRADNAGACWYFRRALGLMRAAPPSDPNLPYLLQDLGGVLLLAGRPREAAPYVEEAATLFHERYGPEHVAAILVGGTQSRVAIAFGDFDRAEALARESLAGLERIREETLVPQALVALADVLRMKGANQEAEALCRKARSLLRAAPGPAQWAATIARTILAEAHRDEGRLAEAEAEARGALEDQAALPPDGRGKCRGDGLVLGTVLAREGRLAEAEPYLRAALEDCRRSSGEQSWMTAGARGDLGECLAAQGRREEAEPLLAASFADLKLLWGDRHPWTLRAADRLARLRATAAGEKLLADRTSQVH